MRARWMQHLAILALVIGALTLGGASEWAGSEGVAHVPAMLDALLP